MTFTLSLDLYIIICCTAVGHLFGNPIMGLAIGTGIIALCGLFLN